MADLLCLLGMLAAMLASFQSNAVGRLLPLLFLFGMLMFELLSAEWPAVPTH